MVQSRAPLSTTVTLALDTSSRSRVSSTVARICRPYWFMTLLVRLSSTPPSPGSTVTWTSLDSNVPAAAGFRISMPLPPAAFPGSAGVDRRIIA